MFWILLCCFLVFLLLLYIPVTLAIDTAYNRYELQVPGFAKASLEPDDEKLFKVKLNVLFFTTYFDPLKNRSLAKKKEKSPKKMVSYQQGIRLLKTFRIKKFWLDLDTGNYMVNAKMYPVFVLLDYYGVACHINFEGRNRLILRMQNRPIHLIKSFINF